MPGNTSDRFRLLVQAEPGNEPGGLQEVDNNQTYCTEEAERLDQLLRPHPVRDLHQSLLRLHLHLPWQGGALR